MNSVQMVQEGKDYINIALQNQPEDKNPFSENQGNYRPQFENIQLDDNHYVFNEQSDEQVDFHRKESDF